MKSDLISEETRSKVEKALLQIEGLSKKDIYHWNNSIRDTFRFWEKVI